LPPALVVSIFLIAAAIALLLAPMPPWVSRIVAVSIAMVGIVYICDALDLLKMTDKAFLLRYSLVGLSIVIVVCVAAWRFGGPKVWRR
jgi:hypothetical protein